MEASDISEVMEQLFGDSAFMGGRLFACCITRGEMMLVTDGTTGRTAGKAGGRVVFVPVVCGQCERVFGGLGESTGKAEIDERIVRGMAVFKKVEEWCGNKEVDVVRQIQRAEAIGRAGAEYAVGMQTVVNVIGGKLQVADHLQAGFI
jgi:hypothetical protein